MPLAKKNFCDLCVLAYMDAGEGREQGRKLGERE